jgi:hypothetical protein
MASALIIVATPVAQRLSRNLTTDVPAPIARKSPAFAHDRSVAKVASRARLAHFWERLAPAMCRARQPGISWPGGGLRLRSRHYRKRDCRRAHLCPCP